MTQPLATHSDSWVAPADLTKVIPPYRKSHAFEGDYADAFHAELAARKSKMFKGPMEGSLRAEDALKLYELAFFAGGDILELGTFRGLSSWIMAQALQNAGVPHRVVTIDLSPELSAEAHANLDREGLANRVEFIVAEGADGIRMQAKRGARFDFAFIDHSHRAEHVLSASRELPSVLNAGAAVAYHDFNDFRNPDAAYPGYGVIEGVEAAQEIVSLTFRGIYGCLGVYQYAADGRGTGGV